MIRQSIDKSATVWSLYMNTRSQLTSQQFYRLLGSPSLCQMSLQFQMSLDGRTDGKIDGWRELRGKRARLTTDCDPETEPYTIPFRPAPDFKPWNLSVSIEGDDIIGSLSTPAIDDFLAVAVTGKVRMCLEYKEGKDVRIRNFDLRFFPNLEKQELVRMARHHHRLEMTDLEITDVTFLFESKG